MTGALLCAALKRLTDARMRGGSLRRDDDDWRGAVRSAEAADRAQEELHHCALVLLHEHQRGGLKLGHEAAQRVAHAAAAVAASVQQCRMHLPAGAQA